MGLSVRREQKILDMDEQGYEAAPDRPKECASAGVSVGLHAKDATTRPELWRSRYVIWADGIHDARRPPWHKAATLRGGVG